MRARLVWTPIFTVLIVHSELWRASKASVECSDPFVSLSLLSSTPPPTPTSPNSVNDSQVAQCANLEFCAVVDPLAPKGAFCSCHHPGLGGWKSSGDYSSAFLDAYLTASVESRSPCPGNSVCRDDPLRGSYEYNLTVVVNGSSSGHTIIQPFTAPASMCQCKTFHYWRHLEESVGNKLDSTVCIESMVFGLPTLYFLLGVPGLFLCISLLVCCGQCQGCCLVPKDRHLKHHWVLVDNVQIQTVRTGTAAVGKVLNKLIYAANYMQSHPNWYALDPQKSSVRDFIKFHYSLDAATTPQSATLLSFFFVSIFLFLFGMSTFGRYEPFKNCPQLAVNQSPCLVENSGLFIEFTLAQALGWFSWLLAVFFSVTGWLSYHGPVRVMVFPWWAHFIVTWLSVAMFLLALGTFSVGTGSLTQGQLLAAVFVIIPTLPYLPNNVARIMSLTVRLCRNQASASRRSGDATLLFIRRKQGRPIAWSHELDQFEQLLTTPGEPKHGKETISEVDEDESATGSASASSADHAAGAPADAELSTGTASGDHGPPPELRLMRSVSTIIREDPDKIGLRLVENPHHTPRRDLVDRLSEWGETGLTALARVSIGSFGGGKAPGVSSQKKGKGRTRSLANARQKGPKPKAGATTAAV